MSSAARKVTVNTGAVRYDVRIGAGLLATLGQDVVALIAKPGKQPSVFVVTSPAIWKLWEETFLASFSVPPTMLTVPAGEQHKRLAMVERLAEEMTQAGADRDSVLIAFGGGVVGDMAGFLAAIYMRGIRYIQVPTTLLAQVDSSVGGKTGVNLAAGKNLIGSFHHPLAVFADTDVLATLPATELRAGLQESVKTGIIRDAKLFELLESRSAEVLAGDTDALIEVITASVQVKANVVEADEREAGLRMILNLGHTLGHAIEAATGYTQLLHGEAVAWGMLAAVSLARGRDLVTEQEAARMKQVIQNYGPMKHFKADAADLVERTARDKKNRSGSRSFVLPVGIGDAVVVSDVSEKELLDVTVDILRLATAETPR